TGTPLVTRHKPLKHRKFDASALETLSSEMSVNCAVFQSPIIEGNRVAIRPCSLKEIKKPRSENAACKPVFENQLLLVENFQDVILGEGVFRADFAKSVDVEINAVVILHGIRSGARGHEAFPAIGHQEGRLPTDRLAVHDDGGFHA